MLLSSMGRVDSIANFVTVLLIFLFVIAITWFSTRYMAGIQKQRMETANIEVLETSRIAANKYLQIVRAGDKYLLIAVGKDEVTMLTELSEDSLSFREAGQMRPMPNFASVLKKAVNRKNREATTKKEE